MAKTYPLFFLTIGFFLLAVLPGCHKQKIDSFLFTDTSCHFPCWQNITPGKTTSEEIIKLLSDSPLVIDPPKNEPEYYPGSYTYTYWRIKNDRSQGNGSIGFFERKVDYITFEEQNLTLGDMVAFYGKPEYVTAISDTQRLRINLIYPKEGVIVSYLNRHLWFGQNSETIKVTPDMPVDFIMYFDPDSVDRILGNLYSSFSQEGIQKILQPWVNFGTILVTNVGAL
jgi:hypothetical protein